MVIFQILIPMLEYQIQNLLMEDKIIDIQSTLIKIIICKDLIWKITHSVNLTLVA